VTSYQPRDHDAGTLTEINGKSLKVVATLSVGRKPAGISVDPNTGTAWVALAGEDKVLAVEEGRHVIGPSLPTGRDPVSVSADTGSCSVFTSNHQDGTVTGYRCSKPRFHALTQISAVVGRPFSFVDKVGGVPSPILTVHGKLPPGVHVRSRPGMVRFSGTPAKSAGHRTFRLTISASNGIGTGTGQYVFSRSLAIQVRSS
jgi:hypothetical protein